MRNSVGASAGRWIFAVAVAVSFSPPHGFEGVEVEDELLPTQPLPAAATSRHRTVVRITAAGCNGCARIAASDFEGLRRVSCWETGMDCDIGVRDLRVHASDDTEREPGKMNDPLNE